MSYQRNWDWEDMAASGLAGLVIVAAIVVAAVAITIVIVLCKEIGRIYLAHARRGTPVAWVLWAAAAALLTLSGIALLLAASPTLFPVGAALSSWSFLAFVVVIEVCDLIEGRHEQHEADAVGELDSYLGAFTPAEPSTNGHQVAAGMR